MKLWMNNGIGIKKFFIRILLPFFILTLPLFQNCSVINSVDDSSGSAELASTEFENSIAACKITNDVAHVTVRRLTRAEYNNTIRDLFDVNITPANSFPLDPFASNFNNNSDIQYLDSEMVENYFTASEAVVAEIFKIPSKIITCTPDSSSTSIMSCVRKILGPIAHRAYRRPVSSTDLAQIEKVVNVGIQQKATFNEAIKLGIQTILMSPHFLFRIEKHYDPKNPLAVSELNDFELASRLSYFVWASTPDEALLDLAESGRLKNPAVLKEQVSRMLKDSKSQSLSGIFVAQWLNLSSLLENHTVNPKLYPNFSEALKKDMQTETNLMVNSVFQGNTPVSDLIEGNYSYLNERLAQHYDIPGVTGTEFRRVSLNGTNRRGLLTQGSFLTATSSGEETSPVTRGRWVLDNIMCIRIDDPPPDTPSEPPDMVNLSRRERLEMHSKIPACYSCHSVMDPIGFSLEKYNAIGKWRTSIENQPIDDAAKLPTGEFVHGGLGLAEVLSKGTSFKGCFTNKLVTYALGRELKNYEKCRIKNLGLNNIGGEKSLGDLIFAIVTNDIFKKQKGDGVDR